jgi:uncharacterized protein
MQSSSGGLPLPQADELTQPYWDAATAHKLVLQRCSQCRLFRHPPAKICASCYSEESEWAEVEGRGTVYSYVIVYQPLLPAFQSRAPYDVVQVTPDGAPNVRLIGNLAEGEPRERLQVGSTVEVVFDDTSDGISIPRWRLT